MKNFNYSKKRHLQLLQDKSLNPSSVKKYSNELDEFFAILNNHLDWENRNVYIQLIELFENEKINDIKFCIDFETRVKLTNDMTRVLISNLYLLSPDERSFEFGNLIENICDECECLLDVANPSTIFTSETEWKNSLVDFENYRIKFKNSIEKLFLKIKNY